MGTRHWLSPGTCACVLGASPDSSLLGEGTTLIAVPVVGDLARRGTGSASAVSGAGGGAITGIGVGDDVGDVGR